MKISTEIENKWNEIFGEKEFAFDFSNNLILKSEYQTDSPFAWDIDYFNYLDKAFFIASKKFIETRNKRGAFIFDDKRFFIVDNNDGTYNIVNDDEISYINNPFNYDLLLSKKINKFNLSENSKKETIKFSIVYQNLKSDVDKLFKEYIIQVLQKLFNLSFFESEKKELKSQINFEINLEKIDVKKIIHLNLILQYVVYISLYQLNKNLKNIWENDEFDERAMFNVFVLLQKENEKFNTLDLLLENKFFVNEEFIKLCKNLENIQERFKLVYEFPNNKIYYCQMINIKFDEYVRKIKK